MHAQLTTEGMFIASAVEKNPMGFFSRNRRQGGGSSRKAAACAWLHRKRKCAPRIGEPMVRRLKRSCDFFSTALTISRKKGGNRNKNPRTQKQERLFSRSCFTFFRYGFESAA